MPVLELTEEQVRILLENVIPVSLKKVNEDRAKKEYEEYKLNKNFKKINELYPLTLYFIIRDLKGNEQIDFIRKNIDYIKENHEDIFIYNMMGPRALSYYLSFDSLKEIYELDKNIFNKMLNSEVENLFNDFSNEEILLFFKEFNDAIKNDLQDYRFVNAFSYAKDQILRNEINDTFGEGNRFDGAFNLAVNKKAELTKFILKEYEEKIKGLDDWAFLRFLNSCLEYVNKNVEDVERFIKNNKERLGDLYKNLEFNKLYDVLEETHYDKASCNLLFNNFGDVIFAREDFPRLFPVMPAKVLCDFYKKNKNYFEKIGVEHWLKHDFFVEIKEVLDDYAVEDFEKILSENSEKYDKRSISYLEGKYRKCVSDTEALLTLRESSSIYSSEYIRNLEIMKRELKNGVYDKNSDVYKGHFKLFVNHLVKEKYITEVNKENINELERYFFQYVKGLSLVKVKELNDINKIALFNRIGSIKDIDSSEFTLEQIQNYNVKEHRLLLDNEWLKNNMDLAKSYRTLTLKLMFLVGYERAKYILELDKNIATLEHLVGNVDVKTVKLDENGDPILNEKIINLLFRDLEKNRIKLMLDNKENELYKYFPRIFNEWETIAINNRHKNLNSILNFLKSDEVCVDLKHYRLKGLFKYIGCKKEIVEDTLQIHDQMLERKEATIPRVKGKLNGYTYEVLKLDDMDGLTVGNRTDCCFTVKGVAYSSLKHALLNKNGRILVIKKDDELVAHSWLWRNGNVLCLDNIEVAKGINEVDFLDVYLKFANHIFEKSSCYEGENTCIKNITVGRNLVDKPIKGIEKFAKISNTLSNGEKKEIYSLPRVAEDNIYSDAKSVQVILLGNGDFKYYDVNCNYKDERDEVLSYLGEEKDFGHINDIVNCLRYIKSEECGKVEDFDLIDVKDYKCVWCNKDWYVLVDENGNVDKYFCSKDEIVRKEFERAVEIEYILKQQIADGGKPNKR